MARHHPLLRPHAAVLGRVRQPRRRGAGIAFWGGSHVYGPEGGLVAEAPGDEPALLSADIDLAAVRRVRREMPLLKEARLGLLSREIERLAAEGGDV